VIVMDNNAKLFVLQHKNKTSCGIPVAIPAHFVMSHVNEVSWP